MAAPGSATVYELATVGAQIRTSEVPQAGTGHVSRPKVVHKTFPAFDIFRGVGILFVIAGHAPDLPQVLEPIRALGALGVHMFFALSGFLITHRMVEEFDQTGRVDLKRFYQRRVRRILPPALLFLGTVAVLGPVLGWLPSSPREIGSSLLFFRNLYQPAIPAAWYTAHFWTLSLEEQFYIVWPLLLVTLGPLALRARGVALGIILATVVWRSFVLAGNPAANPYRTDLLADHLMWGCLLGLLWSRIGSWLVPRWKVVLGIALVGLATWLLYVQPVFWQPVFAFSVAAGFVLLADTLPYTRWPWSWARTLGLASYDCYLWQSLLLPLPLAGTLLPWPQTAPWSYLLLFLVTAASFRLTFPRRRTRQS